MKMDRAQSFDQVDPRSRAEERLAEKGLQRGFTDAGEDTKRLLHELQVHQVELEMQNEELRATRAALEASLEHYTDLYDFAQMGYFTLDGAGIIREINLAGIALLGKFRSQVLGKRFSTFLHQDSRTVFNDFIERIRAGRAKLSWLVTLLGESPHQSARYLHIEGTPVLWPEQGSSRAVEESVRLAVLDITERKQEEEALRQSEERYRLLVESAKEGIAVEQDGTLKFVNAGLQAMTGYSSGEFISHPFIDFVHPEDREAILNHFQLSLTGGNAPTGCAFRIMDKTGQVKWLHSNSSGIEWENRRATIIFFTDVTEHKRAEDAKAGMEAKLRHGQKMQGVGALVSGIAHEFNNFLVMVLALAELAKVLGRGKRDNTGEIDQIIQTTERASGLVRQMLTFSRKSEVDKKPVGFNSSVIRVVKTLERTLPANVDMETTLAQGLPPVESDASQLDEILINLASNARDAMPEGGTLSISTELVSVPAMICEVCGHRFSGDYVLLSVMDTGEGMDQDTMARMYAPFFTTKGVGKGTGLGLSVVLGLVRENGGHIKCDSSPGAGAIFRIYLPAVGNRAMVDNNNQHLRLAGGVRPKSGLR